MNEEKETVELSESELVAIRDMTRAARKMYRVVHRNGTCLPLHDNVERKVMDALHRIAERTGGMPV